MLISDIMCHRHLPSSTYNVLLVYVLAILDAMLNYAIDTHTHAHTSISTSTSTSTSTSISTDVVLLVSCFVCY